MTTVTGIELKRIYVDRGHDYPSKYRVYRSGQKRSIFGVIKKELSQLVGNFAQYVKLYFYNPQLTINRSF